MAHLRLSIKIWIRPVHLVWRVVAWRWWIVQISHAAASHGAGTHLALSCWRRRHRSHLGRLVATIRTRLHLLVHLWRSRLEGVKLHVLLRVGWLEGSEVEIRCLRVECVGIWIEWLSCHIRLEVRRV